MGARSSRTYKLKLSQRGIALFVECHGRLCRLVGDLLPYGTTLRLSVSLLAALSSEELVAEFDSGEIEVYAGREIRFVGTSPSLAVITVQVAERAVAGGLTLAPQTWRVFLAALSCMTCADDGTVLAAYDRLRASDAALGQRPETT